ncbi:MAG: class I SAM-dependent methyltransferase [Nitrospira sp.]|nr:class I SAM-dependent methyltransferase [Nitrospira sp.]
MLHEHLAFWGLKRFDSDDAYFEWQRRSLSMQELSLLHRHVEQKRQGTSADEIAFYDATADPRILPVLYSQRYEYYLAVGALTAERIGLATSVLDFGCGTGVLTTFYARQFPHVSFLGVDRSPESLRRAEEQAVALGLQNIRFECLDIVDRRTSMTVDLVVATHALLQAEQDPGLPSHDWRTFERDRDRGGQRGFEERTGVGPRLDALCSVLTAQGRMVVFEKTRQLSRRVPFQRALAARGLIQIESPRPIRYSLVEEIAQDGPFYTLQKNGDGAVEWDEAPEPDEGAPFDPAVEPPATGGEAPLYENHYPSAQSAWEGLSGRVVVKERTLSEPDGRQLHAEYGRCDAGQYLYCANTFDRRQLVIVEPARGAMLETYYQEIVGG